MTPEIQLKLFLSVAAFTFALGAAIIVTRRNALGVLMGLELVINGAALNFVAFSHYVRETSRGRSSRYS